MRHNLMLFEFGSTSLKFFFRLSEEGEIQKVKAPWNIGHEVFQTGSISQESTEHAICTIQSLLASFDNECDPQRVIAFATGVFREAKNILYFVYRMRIQTGLSVRVISGDQEAALLKSVYFQEHRHAPAFVFDLGGGTLQWVYAQSEESSQRGSLPIGAIRLATLCTSSAGKFNPDLAYHMAGKYFFGLPHVSVDRLVGTGGTIKTIGAMLGKEAMNRDELEALEKRIRSDGPPPELKAHRQSIFLPGLVIARRLMAELRSRELVYEDLSVGKALLEKIIPFYSKTDGVPHPSEIFNQVHYSDVLKAC